jgi:hypothetical protein
MPRVHVETCSTYYFIDLFDSVIPYSHSVLLYVPPAVEDIYVFHMNLKINSDYFPRQHILIDLLMESQCFL